MANKPTSAQHSYGFIFGYIGVLLGAHLGTRALGDQVRVGLGVVVVVPHSHGDMLLAVFGRVNIRIVWRFGGWSGIR